MLSRDTWYQSAALQRFVSTVSHIAGLPKMLCPNSSAGFFNVAWSFGCLWQLKVLSPLLSFSPCPPSVLLPLLPPHSFLLLHSHSSPLPPSSQIRTGCREGWKQYQGLADSNHSPHNNCSLSCHQGCSRTSPLLGQEMYRHTVYIAFIKNKL